MQSVLSRIWTRVAVSISYDDNDYTTGTSIDNDYTTGTSIMKHFYTKLLTLTATLPTNIITTSWWTMDNFELNIQSTMDKLLYKLHKNENNADILLYQVYLPKLHENISKYCKSNLFKEIAISFNHGLLNLLQAFMIATLFKLVNTAVIFWCCTDFCWSHTQSRGTHNDQENCNRSRVDVATEIFWQSRLEVPVV